LLGPDRDFGLEIRHDFGHAVLARGAHPGADRFEVQQRTADVCRSRGARLQHHADHVGGPVGRRQMDHRSAHVAAAHRDQPVGFQDVDRFAQRRRAHAEFRKHALLGRQHIAFLEPARQDVLPQLGGHDLGRPGLTNALHHH
jgi:hypothetical protein